jgi:peptide/nickel transport system permease protein
MKFLLRRLEFYVVALFAAIATDFFLPRLLPGDPAVTILAPMGSKMTQAQIDALRKALGLGEEPLWKQFGSFLAHLFQGDLGVSYSAFPNSVTDVIATGLKWTLLLGLTSLLLSVVLGHLIGIVGAWRRGGLFDATVPPLANFVGAFPAFFLALMVLYFLGLKLHWFPISHAVSPGIDPGFSLQYIGSLLRHLVMPLLVSVLVNLQIWVFTMRNSMVTVLSEDFITMGEAKGLTQRRIMFNYAARNAILPSVTGFGIFLGSILGGQVLIEQVFSYPGLGFQLVRAVSSRDYPLMGGLFLSITTGILVVNFLVDIVYTYIDPRVRRA